MKKTILLLLSVALTTTVACEHDIEIRTNGEQQELSLHGYLSADSAVNRLAVVMTGLKQATDVHQARVEVCVNGEFREKCKAEVGEEGRRYLITTPFHPGDRVRIDVTTTDGKHHAYVEETVPQPIRALKDVTAQLVKEHKFLSEYGYTDETGDAFELKLTLADNLGSTDYYRFAAPLVESMTVHRYFDSEEGYIEDAESVVVPARFDCTQDPILMEGNTIKPSSDLDMPTIGNVINRYGVFTDRLFRDSEASLCVYLPLTFNLSHADMIGDYGTVVTLQSGVAKVTVESITESEYYYLKALNTSESETYDENSDLTGPIRLPSNVHGGTGYVGFRATKSIECILAK